MKKFIFSPLFLLLSLLNANTFDPTYYLSGRLDPNNGRTKTFREALLLMNQRKVQTIVETGTQRWLEAINCFDGDGGATIIFGHWAKDNNAQMYSVDISEIHIHYSRLNTQEFLGNLTQVLEDSVSFLQNFPKQIDFLYLDSYDYDERNPDPAQQHCLREIQAAENKLTEKSVVMIDDCNVHGGGKGLLAIQYLLSKGWYLHKNFHQVIMLKNSKIEF